MAGVVQHESIATIADSLGLKLTDEALRALAPDLEYRLREVVQEASKFMRHARRAYLTPEDVNNALRLRNVEPQYGFGGRDPARFVRAAGHPDLFFVEDPVVDLQKVMETPLPPLPVEAGVIPHWLAVDGKQPAIPENAPLDRPRAAKRPRSAAGPAAAAAAAAVAASAAAPQAPAADTAAGGAAGAAGAEDTTLVRAPLRHVASAELQLYYERVAALLSSAAAAAAAAAGVPTAASDEQATRAVLASLAADPGLQPLAPHLVHLVAQEVANSLKSLPHLRLLLSAARCMVSNPHLELATYLHQLMPAVMTCLVARRLGASPTEDHWSVRDAAASLLAEICSAYSSSYTSIVPRVQFQLVKALADASKPLATHYGAVVGLAGLGPRAVQTLLLPALQPYMAQLAVQLQQQGQAQQRADAQRVYGALLQAAGTCVFKYMLPKAAATRAAMGLSPADVCAAGTAATKAKAAGAGSTGGSRRLRLAPTKPGQQQQQQQQAAARQGVRKTAGKAAAGQQPSAWRAFFSGEGADDQQQGDVSMEPASAAVPEQQQQQGSGLMMRPANEGREAAGPAAAELPAENVLLQAREEDCDVDAVIAALVALFGRDLEPFMPGRLG